MHFSFCNILASKVLYRKAEGVKKLNTKMKLILKSKEININFLFIEKPSLSLAPCDLVDQGDVGKMG